MTSLQASVDGVAFFACNCFMIQLPYDVVVVGFTTVHVIGFMWLTSRHCLMYAGGAVDFKGAVREVLGVRSLDWW